VLEFPMMLKSIATSIQDDPKTVIVDKTWFKFQWLSYVGAC